MEDGGLPFVPGRVPVDLVVLGEVPERILDAIADVIVDGPLHLPVGIADPDAHVATLTAHVRTVGAALRVGHAHVFDPEAVLESVAVPVLIGDQSVDPVPRLGELDQDLLGNKKIGVLLDLEVGVKALDDVPGAIRERRRREQAGQEHHRNADGARDRLNGHRYRSE